jgi:hypothetical protein
MYLNGTLYVHCLSCENKILCLWNRIAYTIGCLKLIICDIHVTGSFSDCVCGRVAMLWAEWSGKNYLRTVLWSCPKMRFLFSDTVALAYVRQDVSTGCQRMNTFNYSHVVVYVSCSNVLFQAVKFFGLLREALYVTPDSGFSKWDRGTPCSLCYKLIFVCMYSVPERYTCFINICTNKWSGQITNPLLRCFLYVSNVRNIFR